SGAALATRLVPMVPPAPTTFSITIGCFSVAPIELPSGRAITSPARPAENGTTSVIGRLGNSWANAGSAGESNNISKTRLANCMGGSLSALLFFQAGDWLLIRDAFWFDADVRSIMLSAPTAAALT